ncbi:MAG: hypothetical protein EA356_13215 [Geminicoccaceae bacterium]|nr:MAG: hypothetical protein EA356_13215 [Geminicoccaceae bacterium]
MSADGLDFTTLRRRGIEALQAKTGAEWTDYNLHDPGVTLLEAIAFALTDLAYRLDFETADLLTASPSGLELDALGLLTPPAALPARPSTLADLRHAILDAEPDAADVAIRTVASDRAEGVIEIFVWPGAAVEPVAVGNLLRRVRHAYDAVRGIGEDAVTIAAAREVRCRLRGEIEVERDREPAEIAAEIHDAISRLFGRGQERQTFEELRRADRPLDEVFDGPLFHHGVPRAQVAERRQLRPRDLDRLDGRAPEAFFRAVGAIEGVRFVRDLRVEMLDEELGDDPGAAPVLALVVPSTPAECDWLQLTSRGRRLAVDPVRLRRHAQHLRLQDARGVRRRSDPRAVLDPVVGTFRDVAAYTLLEDHLPALYGLRREGLPRTASTPARARSRQLRGYLMQIDQLFANALADIAALPRTYAKVGDGRTYRVADIGQTLPGDDRDLYPADAAVLRDLVAARDDVVDRRGRMLDYLLALYGESFTQNSLRTFDLYRTPSERAAAVLHHREHFLDQIERLVRDRAGAADLRDPNDPGVFARRLGVLLELAAVASDPWLATSLYRHDLELDDAPWPDRVAVGDLQPPANPLDGVVPLTDDGLGDGIDEALGHLRAQGLLQPGGLPRELWLAGIDLERYQLDQVTEGWRLLLEAVPSAVDVAVLATLATRPAAVALANRLRRALIALHRAGEGLIVVEDVLLRPRAVANAEALDLRRRSLRLTVVTSGWTARTSQPGFVDLVRETVRLNAPAHLVPRCVVCHEPATMLGLEAVHAEWRALLQAHLAAPEDAATCAELDRQSVELARLLDELEPGS